jgi:hypothetical protein
MTTINSRCSYFLVLQMTPNWTVLRLAEPFVSQPGIRPKRV